MATVAVVIPSYNHARYIATALESVVRQTFAPVRIVVVDDGSTDNSVEVVESVHDPRIVLLRQENAGAHAALNRGVSEAGDVDFIAILNSDDLFEPARLEQCVAFLESRPGIDLVCTGLRMIDGEGNSLSRDNPKARRLAAVWADPARDPAAWLGVANFAKTTSNFVIRTAYARAHPFRAYRYVHDYFFAVQAAVEGKYAVIPEPLLRYRTHGENTIKRDGAARVAHEILRMNLDLARDLAEPLACSPEQRAAYARYFRELAGNQSDFRAEVFLAITARLLSETPPEQVEAALTAFSPEVCPELAAPAGDSIRRSADQTRLDRVRTEAARSRWLALGRGIGLTPDVFAGKESRPDKELARLRRELKRSAWVRLGLGLGILGNESELFS